MQRQAIEMALSPSVPAGPAVVARRASEDAAFQADRARARITQLEAALAEAQARVANEAAAARRQAAVTARDVVIERFRAGEYDELRQQG